MSTLLSSPVTAAQQQRDLLLGALVGLARSTVNEPKTEDTDHVLAAGLRLAAKPEADTTALERMRNIVETEKHRVAPNCANCTMRCGNTDNYDLARLWNAPAEVRTLKLELLAALFALAQRRSTQRIADEIRNDLFVLAEDWDTTLLSPIEIRADSCIIQAFFRKTSLQTKQKKLLYSYVLPFEMISFHRGHRALCAAQII